MLKKIGVQMAQVTIKVTKQAEFPQSITEITKITVTNYMNPGYFTLVAIDLKP